MAHESPLTTLLQEYEATVRAAGCPVFDYVNPGATRMDIAAALESIGLPMVPDIAAIFGWHNGMVSGVLDPRLRVTETGIFLPTLEKALRTYRSMGDDHSTWFPVMGFTHASAVLVDTSRANGAAGASPAAYLDFQGGWGCEVESMAIPVSWWIEYVKDGTWRWGEAGWETSIDYQSLPRDRKESQLAFV